MSPDEVRALLGYASAIDPRIRRNDPGERQLQVAAWHAQLERADPNTARAAVDAHYARPVTDPPMPGDIRTWCATRANESAERRVLAAIDSAPLNTRPQFDLAAATAAIAARWAAPLTTNPPPRRADRTPRRPMRHTETDRDRQRAGRAITVCFRCATDIPAPTGWNPADPESASVHCEPCRAVLDRQEAAP